MPSRLCLSDRSSTSFGEPRQSAENTRGAKAGRLRLSWRSGTSFASLLLWLGWALLSPPGTHGQSKRPMTLVDLLSIPRVADPQLSPDGNTVAFMLATTNWAANQRVPSLWRINIDGTGLRRLVDEAGASGARWSPDGTNVAFVLRGSVFVVP